MDEEVACKPYTNRRRFSVFTNMIPEKWTTDNIASIWFKWNIFLYTAYFGPSLIMRLYKYWRNECEINEVLFTRQINCSMCASRRNTHCDNQYCFYYTLGKIKSLIDGAQHSLYICMNIFTSVELGAVVLHAHERGVSVKIGANYSTAFATGSQLAMLHASGKYCVPHFFILLCYILRIILTCNRFTFAKFLEAQYNSMRMK